MPEIVEFTLRNQPMKLDRTQVKELLRKVAPEVIQKVYVEVEGKKYPVKQAFSAVTKLPRTGFTSHEALRPFEKLGFATGEVRSPALTSVGAHANSLFDIHGEQFETSTGEWTANLINTPGDQASDRMCFRLRFTEPDRAPRTLELWLSEAGLHHDPMGTYKKTARAVITGWLQGEDASGRLFYFG